MGNLRNKKLTFSLRKCKLGLASAIIASSLFAFSQAVSAAETTVITDPNAVIVTDVDTMSDQAVIIDENLVNDQTASEMASNEIDAKLSQPTVPISQAKPGDIISVTEEPSDTTETVEEDANSKVQVIETQTDVINKTLVDLKEIPAQATKPLETTTETEITYQDGSKIINQFDSVIKTTIINYLLENGQTIEKLSDIDLSALGTGKILKVVTDHYDFYIEITTVKEESTTPGNNYPAKPVLTGLHTPQASYNLKVTATEKSAQLPHTGQKDNRVMLYIGLMLATSGLVLRNKAKKD